MELLSRLSLLVIASTVVACGDRFTDLPKKEPARKLSVSQLSGIVQTTEGPLDLSQDGGLPTVLQFASDACGSCLDEAKHFKAHLKDSTKAPSKIRLITILNGAIADDAQFWKKKHGIPWPVAHDFKADVFRTYCTEDSVPCLVVHLPEKGIVMSRHGLVPLPEVLNLTGPWEDDGTNHVQALPQEEEPTPQRSIAKDLSGSLETTDGIVDLVQDIGKPTILQFASETCSSCLEETKHMKGLLKDATKAPDKVRVITVLIGAIAADAQFFKQKQSIPWPVAYDLKGDVFKMYCAEDTVPCLVVQVPGKGIVMSRHGLVDLKEVLNLTGPWEESL